MIYADVNYRQTSIISYNLVGNQIVDYSDIVGSGNPCLLHQAIIWTKNVG